MSDIVYTELSPLSPPPSLADGEFDHADWDGDDPIALCEVLDRVLNKGVVVRGDVVLSVAGIDLVYLGLDVLLCSIDKAGAIGVHTGRAGGRR